MFKWMSDFLQKMQITPFGVVLCAQNPTGQPPTSSAPSISQAPTLTLQRLSTGEEGTFGSLLNFSTGELPWRDNHSNFSCIPAGAYRVEWTASWKKKPDGSPEWPDGTYELTNTPLREGIRIHSGNYCGDVTRGWQSDVSGCIILGMGKGSLINKNGKMQTVVVSSKIARSQFETRMNRQPFTLIIRDVPPPKS